MFNTKNNALFTLDSILKTYTLKLPFKMYDELYVQTVWWNNLCIFIVKGNNLKMVRSVWRNDMSVRSVWRNDMRIFIWYNKQEHVLGNPPLICVGGVTRTNFCDEKKYGRWFSPVSSTNTACRLTDILLKVALETINQLSFNRSRWP